MKHLLFFNLICLLLFGTLCAQTPQPVARFSFNNGLDCDEISGKKIKRVGANFAADRFGNERSAIFTLGNESSYVNLGTYKALKPRIGSISLWIDIEHPAWAGTGALYNPVIITKNTSLNDFYESYALYYMLETKRLVAVMAEDSTRDLGIYTSEKFERNQWHHIVVMFDDHQFSMYLDGVLEQSLVKNFVTKYYESDSVMLGNTANVKNHRWLNASLDDVEFYDRILTAQEVLELYHAPNPNRTQIIFNWILLCAGIIAFIVALYFFVKNQIRKGIIKQQQQMETQNKLLETELKVNRASMDPHFLFNSLNALHNFILDKDYVNASDYLLKFSKLIRKTLDSNAQDNITLEAEVELLERYLEIENLRFEKYITHTITIDESLVPSVVYIPVMMIQPFVENAIWHGLLDKPGEKVISISFKRHEERYVYCRIEDNGLGRRDMSKTIFERKSMATNFIRQRLELLNKIYGLRCELKIEDKPAGSGTIVTITLPILN